MAEEATVGCARPTGGPVEGGIPYPMLSDAGGKVGKIYGNSFRLAAGQENFAARY